MCRVTRAMFFFCRNIHSVSRFIYASRVGDGICDCCDGSDERGMRGKVCANTCAEEAVVARASQEQRRLEIKEGLRRLEEAKVEAAAGVAAWREERSRLEKALPELEQKQAEAKTRRDHAQGRWDAEVKAAEAEQKAADVAEASEAAAEADAVEAAKVAQADETAEGAEMLSKTGGDTESEGDSPAEPEAQPRVSEYAKWALDQQQKDLLQAGASEAAGGSHTPPPSSTPPEPESLAVEQLQEPEAKRELDVAKKAFDEADTAFRDSKRSKGNLEKKLIYDLGNGMRWFSLVDRCVEKQYGEYKYKICFFSDATQDHTSLGRFSSWEDPLVMKFEHGQSCPGGESRSLAVQFVCGPEEDILNLAETSKCTYRAEVGHPGACAQADLQRLEEPADEGFVLMPHEEL